MAVGLGIGVHALGINLTALFAAGAVFAIGLGFAMQNIAQNFVSGLILLVERAIKPGDVLEVDGRLVRVVRMGIRATVSRTLDDEDLIIPNSTLVQSTVKNYTLRDPHYRVRSAVGVVYGSDMALVRRTLEEAARNFPGRDPGTEPRILLLGFGTSSVDFEVSIWTTNPWRMRTVRSELNETIWWAFKSAGVTIAFPQLDVHFDPPIADSLHALAAH
jgi:small-conductance mechanosensitive channel